MADGGVGERDEERRAVGERFVEGGGLEIRRRPESRLIDVEHSVSRLVRHDVEALGGVHDALRLLVHVVEELETLPVVEGVEVLSGAELHEQRLVLVPLREVSLEEVLPHADGAGQRDLSLPVLEGQRAWRVGRGRVPLALDGESWLADIRNDRRRGHEPDGRVWVIRIEADRGPRAGGSCAAARCLPPGHGRRLRNSARAFSTGSVFTMSSFVSQAFRATPSP